MGKKTQESWLAALSIKSKLNKLRKAIGHHRQKLAVAEFKFQFFQAAL